jgi:hypothetical protein
MASLMAPLSWASSRTARSSARRSSPSAYCQRYPWHEMRLLTWNLNHRAAPRAIPAWVPGAIAEQRPDVAVLTEYVEGPAHDGFLAELAAFELAYPMFSMKTPGHNQLLMVSRNPLARGTTEGPAIHPAVPPNTLHAVESTLGLHLIGCRIPAFDKSATGRAAKRAVWDWLIKTGHSVGAHPAAVTGDLNTAIGDSARDCGDLVQVLAQHGWQHAIPPEGFSWKHGRSGAERRIDHTFLSPPVPKALL